MIRRLRRILLGRPEETAMAASPLASAARKLPGSMVAGPMPFEAPPDEPVDLDPDALPWELREGSASGPSQ